MSNKLENNNYQENIELNSRQQEILNSIINLYILKAVPIGSRPLSKHIEGKLNLSPATIRNVMADLEDMNYIAHPHTSAGRVPTDKGYRYYVDSLFNMDLNNNKTQTENVWAYDNSELLNLENLKNDGDTIFREASKIIGMMSKFLAIVTFPDIYELIVEKIELIQLSSTKILVVTALNSNIVRTVTMENNIELNSKNIELIKILINERVQGRTLQFIKDNFFDLVKDVDSENAPIIRLFIDSLDLLFEKYKTNEKVITTGTQNLLDYPESINTEKLKSVIELVENDNIIIHLLDNNIENLGTNNDNLQTKVLIGKEIKNDIFEDYSLVISPYHYGNAIGTIGVIGPKRMNYQKMISLINTVSNVISIK